MNVKLYAYWATVEISTTYLLLRGISSQAQMLAFLTSHGMAVFTTYLIFTAVIGADHRLRGDVMRPGFMLFLLAVPFILDRVEDETSTDEAAAG